MTHYQDRFQIKLRACVKIMVSIYRAHKQFNVQIISILLTIKLDKFKDKFVMIKLEYYKEFLSKFICHL